MAGGMGMYKSVFQVRDSHAIPEALLVTGLSRCPGPSHG
jgi:hypothetical protein